MTRDSSATTVTVLAVALVAAAVWTAGGAGVADAVTISGGVAERTSSPPAVRVADAVINGSTDSRLVVAVSAEQTADRRVELRRNGTVLNETTLSRATTTVNVTVPAGSLPAGTNSTVTAALVNTSGNGSTVVTDDALVNDARATVSFPFQAIGGRSVVVENVTLSREGFVTVRRENPGEGVGELVAISENLSAGTYRNLTLPTGARLVDGGPMVARVVIDEDRDHRYDDGAFGGPRDPPFAAGDGSDVAETSAVRVADDVLTVGTTYWQGEVLAFRAENGSHDFGKTYQVRRFDPSADDDQGEFVTEVSLDQQGTATVNTSNVSGQFVLVDERGRTVAVQNGVEVPGEQGTFEVVDQEFDAEIRAASVRNEGPRDEVTTEFVVDSVRSTFDVLVHWETGGFVGPDDVAAAFDDSYRAEPVDLDGDFFNDTVLLHDVQKGDRATLNFTGVEGAAYNFSFVVTDTGRVVRDELAVVVPGEGSASFEQRTLRDQRGDVVEIPLSLSGTDTARVRIGEESVGYLLEFGVVDEDDDNQVTVRFDTFAASLSPEAAVSAVGDDRIRTAETVLEASGPLSAATYLLNVSAGTRETDVGALVLEEPATTGASTSVAPSAWLEPGNLTASNVTEADTAADAVAVGDWAFLRVDASGLDGYLDDTELAGGSIDAGLSVEFRETDPPLNRPPHRFTASAANVSVVEYPARDRFFVAWNTTGTPLTGNASTYEVTFRVDGRRNPVVDANQSANATIAVERPRVTFGTARVPAEDTELIGESNLAPGTGFTVTARSDDGYGFIRHERVEVRTDGSVVVPFDFADVSVETGFDVWVSGRRDATEARGRIFPGGVPPAGSEAGGEGDATTTVGGNGTAGNDTGGFQSANATSTTTTVARNVSPSNATTRNDSAENATTGDNSPGAAGNGSGTGDGAEGPGSGGTLTPRTGRPGGDRATTATGQPGFGVRAGLVGTAVAGAVAVGYWWRRRET